jgi:Protein of unknown function (DUF3891)
MILHLEPPSVPGTEMLSARDAIAHAQRTRAERYKLVHQPDHAHLAGELVQHLVIPGAPPLAEEIIRGIWAHDEGWAEFDSGKRKFDVTPARYVGTDVATNEDGKPLSFFDIKAADALQAWRSSIETAEAIGPLAGLIVSGHFYRLAALGLSTRYYRPDEEHLARAFIQDEEQRRDRLMKRQTRSADKVSYWIGVLRFCDLLSLYLCCGAQDAVEFPERLGPHHETIRLKANNGVREFSSAIFDRETEFVVTAHEFPRMISSSLRFTLR